MAEINNYTSGQTSPVSGHGKFKALSAKYKKFKKKVVGNTDANLLLYDQMLASIRPDIKENSIEFRITDKTQKKKAYNHITGDTLPARPFLPDDEKDGKFKRNITKQITEIIRNAQEG